MLLYYSIAQTRWSRSPMHIMIVWVAQLMISCTIYRCIWLPYTPLNSPMIVISLINELLAMLNMPVYIKKNWHICT